MIVKFNGQDQGYVCLFVYLRLYIVVNNFSVILGRLPVLSNGDDVSCSRKQHRAPGEDRSPDLAIKSLKLSQLS